MGSRCKKVYILIAGLICLGLGVALGIMAVIQSESHKSDKDDSPIYKFNSTLLYVILGAAVILVFMGVLGITGVRRKSVGCVNWFQRFNCICLLFFILVLTALGILHFSIINDLNDVERCEDNFLVGKVDKFYKVGIDVLGSSDCPVRLSDVSDIVFYTERGLVYDVTPDEGAESVYDCLEFGNQVSEQFKGNYTYILKSLEKSHECGGMCSYNDYYVFSDITLGTPGSEQSCAQEVYDKLNGKTLIYFIAGCIVVGFLFLNVSVAWNIQRKKKPETYLDDSDFGGAKNNNPQQKYVDHQPHYQNR